jgi:hypothetical protein
MDSDCPTTDAAGDAPLIMTMFLLYATALLKLSSTGSGGDIKLLMSTFLDSFVVDAVTGANAGCMLCD